MQPNNFNFDNVSFDYLQSEFNIDEQSRIQTMIDYQDYRLKQQDGIIDSLKQSQELHKETIADLKEIIDQQNKLINLLKNSIKNRNQ